MEGWRRSVLLENTQYFASLTELNINNPVISVIAGSEDEALKAHRFPLPPKFLTLCVTLLHFSQASSLFQMQGSAKIWISC